MQKVKSIQGKKIALTADVQSPCGAAGIPAGLSGVVAWDAYFTPKQPPIPIQTLSLIPIRSRPGVPLNTGQWAFAMAGWLVMGYNVAH